MVAAVLNGEERAGVPFRAGERGHRGDLRFRPIVADLSSNPTHVRDPRFAPLVTAVDAEKLRRNYSFLDTYRATELASLKTSLSDLKAKAKKRRTRALTAEAVKQGKKPFFLKRSEVKKRALTEQWEGMKGRDQEKALKRRRKKISERERRAMPRERRGQDV